MFLVGAPGKLYPRGNFCLRFTGAHKKPMYAEV